MHQPVGQLSRTREEQQAFRVQIETTDRLPLALKQFGQSAENGRPVLRIVVSHDFPGGLVVGNDTRGRRVNPYPDGFAVDLYGIAELDALSDVRRLAIDGNAPFQNQLLHFEPGTEPGLGQYLVEFGRLGLRCQHALGQLQCHIFFIRVKLTRDDVLKPDGVGLFWRASRLCGRCHAVATRPTFHYQIRS